MGNFACKKLQYVLHYIYTNRNDNITKEVIKLFHTDTKALKKRMIDHEISSIQQLSDLSGINRKTLSDVLDGDSRPSSNVISALAETLDMKSEEIGLIFFAEEVT